MNGIKPPPRTNTKPQDRPVLIEQKLDSAAIEHYLRSLRFPATKQEILRHAETNFVPENILAFYKYRLPEKLFKRPSDVSFASFVSAYFFGQD